MLIRPPRWCRTFSDRYVTIYPHVSREAARAMDKKDFASLSIFSVRDESRMNDPVSCC